MRNGAFTVADSMTKHLVENGSRSGRPFEPVTNPPDEETVAELARRFPVG
jgi:hypothetical protein